MCRGGGRARTTISLRIESPDLIYCNETLAMYPNKNRKWGEGGGTMAKSVVRQNRFPGLWWAGVGGILQWGKMGTREESGKSRGCDNNLHKCWPLC